MTHWGALSQIDEVDKMKMNFIECSNGRMQSNKLHFISKIFHSIIAIICKNLNQIDRQRIFRNVWCCIKKQMNKEISCSSNNNRWIRLKQHAMAKIKYHFFRLNFFSIDCFSIHLALTNEDIVRMEVANHCGWYKCELGAIPFDRILSVFQYWRSVK